MANCLIFFEKKSKLNKGMSMIKSKMFKVKWATLTALLIIIAANFVIDFFLFSGKREQMSMETLAHDGRPSSRFIASFVEKSPVLKFSLEKQAFEDIEKSGEKGLIARGEEPTVMDRFIFGSLRGQYQVFQKDNKVVELHFTSPYLRPKNLPDRQSFLEKNLSLFSDEASKLRMVGSEHDLNSGYSLGEETLKEKFQILSYSGQGLGQIKVLLDKDHNLMSMKIEKL